jgi:uroporphyrin-III C-methyltransferase
VGFCFLDCVLGFKSTMNQANGSTGKVFLVGAGPGDPKLLTIRAAEAIAASDVIVYDYLVNPEVLAHARRDVELIYAGKRAGEPSISQAQINRLLIERALERKLVVRLKGGDPFIFGRGGEEAEALVEAGIEWEVIPGVSSGVAAAAYAGIPLTHRGYSSSVAFITGHDAFTGAGGGVDWPVAAHAADTLVIFMCAQAITTIARRLIDGGRAGSTPIAIIRSGTYQHQEVYTGTLDDLTTIAEAGAFKIEPPAIAIIGTVAALSDKLKWFGSDELRYALRSLSSVPFATLSDLAEGESYVASRE